MIERHGNEETEVFEGHDEPGKPWTFTCECGAISWHKTEKAADRARSKHMNDESLYTSQVEAANGAVELAVQALYHRLEERTDAVALLVWFRSNQPKRRK